MPDYRGHNAPPDYKFRIFTAMGYNFRRLIRRLRLLLRLILAVLFAPPEPAPA